MLVSQKCQYGLRAIFELAWQNSQKPVKISEIASNQAIPMQFLEVILSQLKQGRFVASKRGSKGGYLLIRSPGDLTIGEVIRFIQGPIGPVECIESSSADNCPLYGNCAFLSVWEKVQKAISDVYDNITFQDLVDQEKQKETKPVLSYSI